MRVFQYHGLIEAFDIETDLLDNFLREIEGLYHPSNPYHNNYHAADVTWSLHHLLCKSGLSESLTKRELFSYLFAAIVHDCDHPGFNNGFLSTTDHPLAIMHNDFSILESHHCSTGFRVARKPANDIFKNISRSEYREMRKLIIYLVLGTDFGRNDEIMKEMRAMENPTWPMSKEEDRKKIVLLCLKCADIGHVSKGFDLHKNWTGRISEEFFSQGDQECALGLPISIGMDRKTVVVASSQTFFIGQIVLPMIKLFCSIFPACNARLAQAEENLHFWKNGGA